MKRCKKCGREMIWITPLILGSPHWECNYCVEKIDFWLSFPILIFVIGGSIYYTIFPIAQSFLMKYGLLFIAMLCLILFISFKGNRINLKELFIKARTI